MTTPDWWKGTRGMVAVIVVGSLSAVAVITKDIEALKALAGIVVTAYFVTRAANGGAK